VPDAGAIAELLRVTTGRQPDFVVGKPNPAVVEWVLRDVGATGSECLFIGDRVYTDYALAQACGGHFIGVLSGDSSRRDFEGLTGITVFSSVKEVFGAQTP
jgi:ribonucleotide monophosphatase NagD (HAD superfamily)